MEYEKELFWKVVLIGENKTGKTSIVNRLIYQTFDEDLKETMCPCSYNMIFKYQSKNKIKLNIWDLPGGKKFRPLNKLFIKNADVVVFVYNIIDKTSFEEITNYWYDIIQDYIIKTPSI